MCNDTVPQHTQPERFRLLGGSEHVGRVATKPAYDLSMQRALEPLELSMSLAGARRRISVVADILPLGHQRDGTIRLRQHTLAPEHGPECLHEDSHQTVPTVGTGLGAMVMEANEGLNIRISSIIRGMVRMYPRRHRG